MLYKLSYRWLDKHPDLTDIELINKYNTTSDTEWVAELFGRYAELIYGVALKYLSNASDAEDALLDIYSVLTAKLAKHNVDHFKSWLYRLTTNYCIDIIRKKKPTKVIPIADHQQLIDNTDALTNKDEQELVFDKMEECMKTLKEEQRECIDLFYIQSKSYQEISEQLMISWSNTRSNIQNGKRKLKICMDSK